MGAQRQINGALLARLIGSWAQQRPYYRSVGQAIGDLVLDGRLPAGTRLPAERDLATALGLSRNTVTAAYSWLWESDLLERRQGAGSWTTLPDAGSGDGSVLAPRPGYTDLGIAAPAAVDGLQPAAERAASQLRLHSGESGYTRCGVPELRRAIARRYSERGLPTRPEQIFVTSGAQHAMTLLLDLLVDPGSSILLESPTYPHALASPRKYGARILTCGVGRDGWDMENLVAALRQWEPQLAYLIPDFHNPTGALLGAEERACLTAEARRTGTSLLIDESVAELAIDPVAQPAPLASHDTDGRVFTIGSAAKLLWGGLRVGWIRTSTSVVARLMTVRQRVDLTSSVLDQLTVADLFSDLSEIRAQRGHQLRRNRDALAVALGERLPEWRFTLPRGGLSLWCELPQLRATALADAALRRGVHIAPGPVFGTTGTLERYVRIPFTQPPDVLTEAVGRLAEAYAETVPSSSPYRPELYV